MWSLQGPVIFPTVCAKQDNIYHMSISSFATSTAIFNSRFGGYKDVCWRRTSTDIISRPLHIQKLVRVQCTFSSSSDGSGNKAEKFNENDGDYVNSSVTEAVEVTSGSDIFTIKMRDGRFLRCVHNSPQQGYLPGYAPHPAIVLKMEDGTDILLPIIVGIYAATPYANLVYFFNVPLPCAYGVGLYPAAEMPSVLLMAAMRNVHIPRPTMYQVIKDMIEKMGYEVKLVRVTKRVHEAYFAEIYLSKAGDEADCISFELRPSDAVNIAVRCKVPIQVNKNLAYSDGITIIESAKLPNSSPASDGLPFFCTELDQPSSKPCSETTEFNLMRNMLDAASEERYQDAAQWRNKLTEFRARRNWT